MIQVMQSLLPYCSRLVAAVYGPVLTSLLSLWVTNTIQAAKKMTEEEYHPNTPVIRQGEVGKEFYIIEQG